MEHTNFSNCGCVDTAQKLAFRQGRESVFEELKKNRFWKEGEGKEQITYLVEMSRYPHDERCEGSMCWCSTRAEKEEKKAWLCKNGHGNSYHELNCYFCGAKKD